MTKAIASKCKIGKAIRKAKEVCGGGKGEEMGVMDHIILIVVPVTTWNKSTD